MIAVPGVDKDLPGMGDYSPAVLAATKNEYTCLQHLVDAGIDVNQSDDTGWTLLHHTTAQDATEALHVLLRRRELLVDCLNSEGHTPLMLACIKNSPSMIEALVGAGADFLRRHKKTKQSCMDMCATELARLAVEAGGIINSKRVEVLEQEEEEKRMLERAKAAAAAAAAAPSSPMAAVTVTGGGSPVTEEGGEGKGEGEGNEEDSSMSAGDDAGMSTASAS